tara:strand:+ start:160 stop:699 length:540 start_codon:yes stop_codon:yes gene_type:complete
MAINGRYLMKRIILFKLFLVLVLCSFLATAGKKHCQDYRKKLDNIQSKQRQANSNKRSNSLSTQEATARNKWWSCETGKLKVKTKTKTKTKKRKKSKKKITNKQKKLKPSSKAVNNKPLVPFASSSPLVVRAKYQGAKLQAWLQFYQAAKVCARPKSTQQFAACVEDKHRQQVEFEKSY